jgi:hypothetical protein
MRDRSPYRVKLLPPGGVETKRLPNGRRELRAPFNLELRHRKSGKVRKLSVPVGFDTDLSSWFWIAPPYYRIDHAGVAHDALCRWWRWGPEPDAEPIGILEANRVWYSVARHGQEETRANLVEAWAGRCGLFFWAGWKKLTGR